jgi:hypothetical protein
MKLAGLVLRWCRFYFCVLARSVVVINETAPSAAGEPND